MKLSRISAKKAVPQRLTVRCRKAQGFRESGGKGGHLHEGPCGLEYLKSSWVLGLIFGF